MATRGGKREGAGRKSKADELTLIESMDAILVPEKFWAAVALNAVDGDGASQKLWASYRFGVPKQSLELTGANGGPVESKLSDTQFDLLLNKIHAPIPNPGK